MNQDQVKEKLLELDNSVEDFTVVFSGKVSKKVDGLYHSDKKEIIIHNKNFTSDNALIYTAIHEFAHHIQFTKAAVTVTTRSHTSQFWDILHRLLYKAEEKKIYINIFEQDHDFIELTKKIRDNFLKVNGHLMKEFGQLLSEAKELCLKYQASFDDYVDRVLQIHHTTAQTIMKMYSLDVNPNIGFENMKTVVNIKDDEIRQKVEEAFIEGKSPDMVKAEYSVKDKYENTLDYLLSEKEKLELTLERVTVKLAKVERRIQELKYG